MRRNIISLDGEWQFHFCGDDRVPLGEVRDWRTAVVPAPWQAQFSDLRDCNGRAWYRRTVDIPADWLASAVFVRFGAVNYHACVLVNGTVVAEHEGGFLPFAVEIGHRLTAGRNDIAVEVTAPTDDPACHPEFPFPEVPFGKQSWYGPIGGIWQSVTLESRSADHIQAVRLVPRRDDGSVDVSVALARALPQAHDLALEVTDPEGRRVASVSGTLAAGETGVVTTVVVPQPQSWSPDTPHLYRLTATLLRTPLVRAPSLRGEDVADTVTESFGFRTVEARDGRIILNGQPIFLRGALDQDYYPDGLWTTPSEAFLEDQFRKAKALGLNCLRCHIKVPDPRYYAVADRVGLLIWAELPNTGRLTDRAAQRAEAKMGGIIERDGNHPSIIGWTIINENWGTDLVHDAGHREWLRRMYHWLKEADPTRLVVDNSPLAPSFHVESDLEDFHFYAAIPDHRRAWDGFIASLASRPAWTYSPHGDARRTGREPILCSEFGNWGLPDPADLKGADGAEPWWFETGHDWGDGVMYAHGVENRFRACGLDRVFGSFRRFVEAAQWQQFRALKYQIEVMRRTPAIAGYVITEFTDCHWESNGLLDMRRNPRVFHDVFATINAETVVVPHWERTAYWAGEAVDIGLTAANGGGATMAGAELRWRLDTGEGDGNGDGNGDGDGDGGGGLGDSQTLDLTPGVHHGRPAAFAAPAVSASAPRRLTLTLATAAGVVATNHLDLVIHPRRTTPAAGRPAVWAADAGLRDHLKALDYRLVPAAEAPATETRVIVTRALDDTLCGQIRDGARVVLLADQPLDLQPAFPHWQAVRVVRREGTMWQGDWASTFSWLRRGGPFNRLPGGPLIDHSFDRVIPRHVIAGCNTWDFQSRVHAGMVIGWVHKPAALIVERDYGLGKVVATTFRLLEDAPGADPTATTLLDSLIDLAAAAA